jgi:hypothetical protein
MRETAMSVPGTVYVFIVLSSLIDRLLRRWHDLASLPYLGQDLPHIRDDPNRAHV